MRGSRTVAMAAVMTVLSLVIAACALSPDDVRREALDAYVEAERGTIPALLSSLPGMYSSLEISGEIAAEVDSAAVIYFTYTYERTMESGAGQAQLKQACETQLFPAIRQAGVTGPVRVFYTFLQPSEEVSWDVSCTSAG